MARRWDPAKHPRDSRGRFIRVGLSVNVVGLPGTSTVTGIEDDGGIRVRRSDGQEQVVPPSQTKIATPKPPAFTREAGARHAAQLAPARRKWLQRVAQEVLAAATDDDDDPELEYWRGVADPLGVPSPPPPDPTPEADLAPELDPPEDELAVRARSVDPVNGFVPLDEIRALGRDIWNEIRGDPAVTSTRQRYADTRQRIKDLKVKQEQLSGVERAVVTREITREIAVAQRIVASVGDDRRRAYQKVIGRTRELATRNDLPVSATRDVQFQISGAIEMLPRDWVRAVAAQAPISAAVSPRELGGSEEGFWELSRRRIVVRRAERGILAHELMHAIESALPNIVAVERDYWRKRTGGEVRQLPNFSMGVRGNEDEFRNPYTGRVYEFVNPYTRQVEEGEILERYMEILSTGMQEIIRGFAAPKSVDDDLIHFTLGMLASAGRPDMIEE